MNSGYFRELWDNPLFDKQMPNGYTRRDYQDFGFTDFEIEYQGWIEYFTIGGLQT